MSRRLVIHIGLPKTGSASIQTFLACNREALLRRSIDYLAIGEFEQGKAGRIGSGNGALIARSMFPTAWPAALPWGNPAVGEAFLNAVKQSAAQDLLLSSEYFTFATIDEWKRLREICASLELDLHLIASLRNPCDWLSSGYMQGVKRHHETADPRTYVTREYKRMPLLHYDSYFRQLSSEVTNRISFLSYDLAAKADDLIPRFMSILGVNDLNGFSNLAARLNLTPRPEEIVFLRQCNIHGSSANFSDVLAEAAPNPDLNRPAVPWTVISPDLASEIVSYFQAPMASFLSAFKLESTFFQPPCGNFVDIENLKVEMRDLISIVTRYLVSFDHRMKALEERSKDDSPPAQT